MSTEIFKGTISFINHEKQYCSIEYSTNGKRKKINGSIAEQVQARLLKENIIRSVHRFLVGDEVQFSIVPMTGSGKMVAQGIRYLYNNALNDLIQKAKTENKFVGYLKLAGENFFIKESSSYVLFPLKLSLWEKRPGINKVNELEFFKLENLQNPGKITAALFNPIYIPAFIKARQLFLNKVPLDAHIYNITPFAIYVHIISNEIQAKITLPEENKVMPRYKIGDTIKVIITFLSSTKIVVEIA